MNARRHFLSLAAGLLAVGALLTGCSTVGALLGNDVSFSQQQLQQSLNRNFPKHYDKLGGLVSMTLMNPRLSIPEGSSRLRLDFDIGLGALGSDSSQPSGRFALSSALRYDPSTRGLHLDQPMIENVDVPALGGVMNSSSRALLNAWLSDYSRQEPVYRFDNSLLDRLGSRRIGATEISNGHVTVHLDQ
ncbi:DUF1439 domain-containing protein [Lysobacter niastensis]|uniref:DUF1439 domain-containing protein n=1 Tax=Lysobacter niastensis TaxID=380629 RepID=A0ABS0B2J4_9GAMM|nr:DUF1439 domain-containing protein [Lysobacter niastensis]MBF6022708.1 DUF1439 domain-containing protein [Lysobacter niastensis]